MLQMGKKINKLKNKFITFIKGNKSGVLTLILLGLVADIFFIDFSSDIRTFGILGLSIFSIVVYKLSSRIIFLLCLGLLVFMFIYFMFTGTSIITEKIAVWFVLFFGVGIIRQWKELK